MAFHNAAILRAISRIIVGFVSSASTAARCCSLASIVVRNIWDVVLSSTSPKLESACSWTDSPRVANDVGRDCGGADRCVDGARAGEATRADGTVGREGGGAVVVVAAGVRSMRRTGPFACGVVTPLRGAEVEGPMAIGVAEDADGVFGPAIPFVGVKANSLLQ